MILFYGDISKLKGLDWYTVELRSEKTVESTLRRLAMAVPSIFASNALEIFVPIAERDLGHFDLKTSNYIFARSRSFANLLRLKQVTGIVGLSTEGDSNRPSQAISVPDDFVQSLIHDAEDEFRNRSQDVEVGSFVRILDGETRDMCGKVTSVDGGNACVTIQLRTKQLLVETPTRNLLNLDGVPVELQVYYYSPLVASLVDTDEAALVQPDLVGAEEDEALDTEEDGLEVEKSPVMGRQQTVTALVKRLIMSGKGVTPMEIATKVVEAMKKGLVRLPKNLLIVHGIIKIHLTKYYLAKKHPEIKSYRDVVATMGDKYKFSVDDIARIDPTLGIPYNTGEADPVGQPRKRKKRVAASKGA